MTLLAAFLFLLSQWQTVFPQQRTWKLPSVMLWAPYAVWDGAP